jgi:hypothetical protein
MGVADQAGNAFLADSTAASRSDAEERGSVEITEPVRGLTTSIDGCPFLENAPDM